MRMKTPALLMLAIALGNMGSSCKGTSGGGLPEPGSAQQTGAISVSLSTDRNSYKAGESIRISVGVSEACHLRVFSVDSAGSTAQIFPNAVAMNDRVSSGQAIRLGGAGSGYTLRAKKPFGREMLWVIASSQPFPPGFEPRPGQSYSAAWSGGASRGIGIEATPAKTGEAKRVIEIRE